MTMFAKHLLSSFPKEYQSQKNGLINTMMQGPRFGRDGEPEVR